MAYEDQRKTERNAARKERDVRRQVDNQREDRWDSQDDGDFRFTDWAAI